jgi:hypothetical protein
LAYGAGLAARTTGFGAAFGATLAGDTLVLTSEVCIREWAYF